MRLHRFYIKEKIGERGQVTLSDQGIIHQMKNVFRFIAGARVVLFDGSGHEYLAIIVSIRYDKVVLEILEVKDKTPKGPSLWLFASLIKKDHFEWIIEKASELGVTGIVPIVSERSEKKSLNMVRGQKILTEASEQSGRVTLPHLAAPRELSEVIHDVTQEKNVAIQGDFEKDEINMNFLSIHPEGKPWPSDGNLTSGNIGVFVGPEGGWSDRELEMFKKAGIPIYSIGSPVLRAETAAIAIAALLLLGK